MMMSLFPGDPNDKFCGAVTACVRRRGKSMETREWLNVSQAFARARPTVGAVGENAAKTAKIAKIHP